MSYKDSSGICVIHAVIIISFRVTPKQKYTCTIYLANTILTITIILSIIKLLVLKYYQKKQKTKREYNL